jgi:hypothetical protein
MFATTATPATTKRRSKHSEKCTTCLTNEKMTIRLLASGFLSVVWVMIFVRSALFSPGSLAAEIWAELMGSAAGIAIAVFSVLAFHALIVGIIIHLQKGKVPKSRIVARGKCASCAKVLD